MKIIAIFGPKNSGKTFIATKLIEYFSKKRNVIAIKHVCKRTFDFDIKGKDSWRMKRAGAIASIVISPMRVGIVWDFNESLNPIDTVLKLCELFKSKPDIIIVEGFRYLLAQREDVLKIVCLRSEEDVEEYLSKIKHPVICVLGGKFSGNIPRDLPAIRIMEMEKLIKIIESKL